MMIRRWMLGALVCALATPACAVEGMASWYGEESGMRTASGQRFHALGNTCAMRTRHWRTVTVTVIASGVSTQCLVNDYGPRASTGRLIDVSRGIARRLGFEGKGVTRVRVDG